MTHIETLLNNNYFIVIASLLTSFLISWIAMPSLITVSRKKNLVDLPNGRTSHKGAIPNLGGVALFASLIITVLTFTNLRSFPSIQYITPGLVILFFIGLKDDVLDISAHTKLKAQILAAAIVVILGNIRFTHLHGFFGIGDIGYLSSAVLSIFVIIVIINCFNLIDGIDGLSGGMGVLISLTFGIWFFVNRNNEYVLVASTLIGALLAFLYYNVFSKKNKIFLGDTGAMILGYMVAILTIQFNEFNITATGVFAVNSAPAVSIAILFLPLYDVLRVFVLRIAKGRSPFSADRQHMHHMLIATGMSHIKATMILLSSQVLFIVAGFSLQQLPIWLLTLLLLCMGLILSGCIKYIHYKASDNHSYDVATNMSMHIIKNTLNKKNT